MTVEFIDPPIVVERKLNHRDGEVVLIAEIYSIPNYSRLKIRYSHAGIPAEGAGSWRTTSMRSGDCLDHAKAIVETYARKLERGYKIIPW